jgi:hypothetical protein
MGLSVVLKTELLHLAGGRADQSCSLRATQLLVGELYHLAQTGSELPQIQIATFPVD